MQLRDRRSFLLRYISALLYLCGAAWNLRHVSHSLIALKKILPLDSSFHCSFTVKKIVKLFKILEGIQDDLNSMCFSLSLADMEIFIFNECYS